MKIKRSQVHGMVQALQQLGQPIVISSDDGKVVQKRLVFDGKVLCDLARNLRVLKDESADIEDMRQKLFQQLATEDNSEHAGDGTTRLSGKAALDFQKQIRETLNEEVDVQLTPVPIGAIKTDSPQILDALSDLIGRVFVNGE